MQISYRAYNSYHWSSIALSQHNQTEQRKIHSEVSKGDCIIMVLFNNNNNNNNNNIYTTKGDACVCVCVQNRTNFCPYALISTPNVP